MELWIRSQDRSNLKKVNNIYMEKITKDYDSWVGNIYSRPYVITSDNGNLGFYATEERALEVLDEIQNILKPKTIINTYEVEQAQFCDGTQIIQPMLGDIQVQNATSYIYEMPKE